MKTINNTQKQKKVESTKNVFNFKKYLPLAIKCEGNHIIVLPNDISYIKADVNSCNFHLTSGKSLLCLRSLKECSALIVYPFLLQINRSTIINLNQIKSFSFADGGLVNLNSDIHFPIGKAFREKAVAIMRKRFMSKDTF